MSAEKTIERIVKVTRCRVYTELKDRTPLNAEEWDQFRNQIVECGLKGIPFDDVSYVLPLQIPLKPRVQVLQEQPRTVSVLTIYDRTNLVGVIGNEELETIYQAHLGAFIFAVGKLEKCKKNDREYINLRPRGWLLVQLEGQNKNQNKEELKIPEEIPEKKRKK